MNDTLTLVICVLAVVVVGAALLRSERKHRTVVEAGGLGAGAARLITLAVAFVAVLVGVVLVLA